MKKVLLLSLSTLFLSLSVNAQVKKLAVEPNHSTVGFSISISGFTKVTGKFTDYSISLDWSEEEVSASKLSSVIQVASINTGIPDRDAHLQSPDFFNAEEYPEIIFESDSIQRVDYSNYQAYGKLSANGITQSIVLPFQIVKVDGNTIGIRSRTTINRLDFGIGSNFQHTSMPDFLAKEVQIEIDFWTKKRKK